MKRNPNGSRSEMRKSGSIGRALCDAASICATWACQTASDAGSPRPIICASAIAAIGRPGIAASTRIVASATVGHLNLRNPQIDVASKTNTAKTAKAQNASSDKASCHPKNNGAKIAKTALHSGQKQRTVRSATSPMRVAKTGHFKWLCVGSQGASCCLLKSQPCGYRIACNHLFIGRACADNCKLIGVNQHFGDHRPRIIFR